MSRRRTSHVFQPTLDEIAFPDGRWCQRWNAGTAVWQPGLTSRDERRAADTWRQRRLGGFDKSRYEVRRIAYSDAKKYVEQHHYLHTFVACKVAFGILDQAGYLQGVIVLSNAASDAVLTSAWPTLRPNSESTCIGRVVLADELDSNAESWAIGQALKMARTLGFRAVVSFCDPVPRDSVDGKRVHPGHYGTIYRATNMLHTGRTRNRTMLLFPDGTALDPRALSKVVNGESGRQYVQRRLEAHGASPPRQGEHVRDWLDRAFDAAGVREQKVSGVLRFQLALDAGVPCGRVALDYPAYGSSAPLATL
ncbi:hypothetical protein [Nonomuraea sp. NPDC049784]|uniref:Mom family adenine methylcarbamoylation protein n=1 Tax=Nonomuraea sp. NPDC049784 TaxID=3154361 RepID=UPI0033DB706B